ncbi:isoleucine--tRNA ligase [Cytophagaceae bacterium DM2B3-1]|uniref:Isoleucine--tRNA ligase n=1 Tax=Xanthocytophaga flava TaxID=3048013 RepID=A0ABT7CCQ5_9BACT|nr:isoleucine--tRNA ligase [Xanthocytophaga flavus]MDJ1491425.1 isoleucine--tRNA ligase [Xanthocytophaga flavus]
MKYKEYKNADYPQIAKDVLAFWKQNRLFEQSVSFREGKPSFTFYEGPPSANGTPGIHHVMARTIKDIFCRYKTLKGFQVKRKGGWDTHGLPIELQVEKELNIKKEDIGVKISIEEYNKKCRETVMRFTDQWNNLTEQMGYWVDLEHPYVTYQNDYIESLWWLLKQLHEKGLLYKGYTIQPYSPAAGTGLSSHELNMPGTYRDVKDTTIVAMFKVLENAKSEFLFKLKEPQTDVFVLAWTTTPWTLPANSALTVGKSIDYVLVKTFNPYTYAPVQVVLAKALVGKYFTEKGKDGDFEAYQNGDHKILPWTVLKEFKGGDLEGVEYEQLLPFVKPDAPAFRVIVGDFVTTEDGTGVVHTSPTFGADDFRVAQQNGIPAIMVKDDTDKEMPVVNRKGQFVKEIGSQLAKKVQEYSIKTHRPLGEDDFYVKNYTAEDEKAGDYKTTDEIISIILKLEGKAFKVEKYEHTYPHCWRTDKPVLYYPLDSWFIRTTVMKDRLVSLNKTINWKPESTGTGRFGNWLENLVDWNLSRSRFWGTPLPIWRSEDDEEVCIGSVEELKQSVTHALKDTVLSAEQREKNEKFLAQLAKGEHDLHRPYVDEVYLVSPSGKVMFREPDLIDVWFDSGAMPYAQWHYPFENQDIFKNSYPADFISEGVDQTRGWFFTLHAIAGMLFDSVAFKNVVSTGLVLDKNGEKMSKRKGNVVDPFYALGKYGSDAVRWYMISNANPWDDLKFSWEKVYEDGKGVRYVHDIKKEAAFYNEMQLVDQYSDGIVEVQRKFFGTLFNTYQFYAMYANLDNYKLSEFDRVPYERLSELDRWVISKLQSLILEVDEAYDNYEPTKATRAIQYFVTEQLSNWYVRLSRRRFWKGELTEDKRAAYETLQECLVVIAQLISPVAPFFADWLYQNMTDNVREEAKAKNTPLAPESVHLTDFVKADTQRIDKKLEESMDLAQRYSSLVHSLRKKHTLRVRQPLSRILLPILNEDQKDRVRSVADLILSETNIKAVEYVDDASGLLVKKIKPNFKKLGKEYGPKLKEVAALIQAMNQDNIRELEKTGRFVTSLNGESLTITPEDVEISAEDIPGWIVASESGLTVALDITLNDDLRREGIARDVVNRIQNLRKDSGLEVQDKIRLTFQNLDTFVDSALESNREYICSETQALELAISSQVTGAVPLDLDEFTLNVKLEVIN